MKFSYKAEPREGYAGFIAEDVPELVASSSGKTLSSMDNVAVAVKVLQRADDRLDTMNTEIPTFGHRSKRSTRPNNPDLLRRQSSVYARLERRAGGHPFDARVWARADPCCLSEEGLCPTSKGLLHWCAWCWR